MYHSKIQKKKKERKYISEAIFNREENLPATENFPTYIKVETGVMNAYISTFQLQLSTSHRKPCFTSIPNHSCHTHYL